MRTASENIHLNPGDRNDEKNKKFFKEIQMNGILHRILKKTQPVMMRKRKMTSGRSQENSFIHRHHVVPRVKLYVPQEETFPIPTKYIDVLMEKHIEDYWYVDGARELSDAWTGFTRFILMNERPPDGFSWSGKRLTRNKQPLVLMMYGQICGRICPMQQRRKQNNDGLSRNPKLDNARHLRNILY